MWKNQGSWNFFHTKLIPNSSNNLIITLQKRGYVHEKNDIFSLSFINPNWSLETEHIAVS